MAIPFSYSWRNLTARKSSTLMTTGGIALAVMAFVVISATGQSMKRTAAVTGNPLNVVVLSRGGASAEASKVPWETLRTIQYLPEVARGPDGEAQASIESVLVRAIQPPAAPLGDLSQGRYTTIRGVTPRVFSVQPEVKIVEGRLPSAPGEILIGQLLPSKLKGAGIGAELRFGRQKHVVVGIFDAGGRIFDGEIWMGLEDLLSEMLLNEPSIAVLRLREGTDAVAFAKSLEDSKRFTVDAQAETDYYAEASRASVAFVILGNIIGLIMGLGAIFAGMNTMYAAMSRRIREIGTLRALGFGRWVIARSFLIESLLIASLGGIAGSLVALAFDGVGLNFFQLAFRLDVGAPSLIRGAVLASLIGLFGGLLPARAASRLAIVEALRHV
ncbi:MAG: ABC transporter permease [Bdellovibrionota bacterium]